MSYPKDLDEYPDHALKAELQRREKNRLDGLCDYCGQKLGVKPACRMKERHNFKEFG